MCPQHIYLIVSKINASQLGRRNYCDNKVSFQISQKILSYIGLGDKVVLEPICAYELRYGSLLMHIGYNRLRYA